MSLWAVRKLLMACHYTNVLSLLTTCRVTSYLDEALNLRECPLLARGFTYHDWPSPFKDEQPSPSHPVQPASVKCPTQNHSLTKKIFRNHVQMSLLGNPFWYRLYLEISIYWYHLVINLHVSLYHCCDGWSSSVTWWNIDCKAAPTKNVVLRDRLSVPQDYIIWTTLPPSTWRRLFIVCRVLWHCV